MHSIGDALFAQPHKRAGSKSVFETLRFACIRHFAFQFEKRFLISQDNFC
jgi:hypothetical protein